jgi:hypothetical protein
MDAAHRPGLAMELAGDTELDMGHLGRRSAEVSFTDAIVGSRPERRVAPY